MFSIYFSFIKWVNSVRLNISTRKPGGALGSIDAQKGAAEPLPFTLK